MTKREQIKRLAFDMVAAVTSRHPVLLPRAAAADHALLDVVAPYRVEDDRLGLTVRDRLQGFLSVTLLGYEGYAPTRKLWSLAPIRYEGPTTIEFDLDRRSLFAGGVPVNGAAAPLSIPRRFCFQLDLRADDGVTYSHTSGHYRAVRGHQTSADYFEGNNYVDYEAESVATRAYLLDLIKEHPVTGTTIEIGCATGQTLEALASAGLPNIGVDFSEWAVKRARERVGADKVFVADADDELPDDVVAQAPFGAIILWSVLEHLAEPERALTRLDRLAVPGSRFFIMTANADSLCHKLFGPDWEGYFDWTHRGVDCTTVSSIRRWLEDLGWHVDMLETTLIWSGNADPMHATVREWWAADARFRRLVEEKDLGDIITCVATKR